MKIQTSIKTFRFSLSLEKNIFFTFVSNFSPLSFNKRSLWCTYNAHKCIKPNKKTYDAYFHIVLIND